MHELPERAMARPAQGSRRRRSRSLGLTTGMLALGLIAMLSITVGSRDIALADILGALRAPDLGDDRHLVVSLLRMPRTVVAILAGLIRLDNLMTIYPGPSAVAFAGVVLVTMVAAMSFDSRLIWDLQQGERERE